MAPSWVCVPSDRSDCFPRAPSPDGIGAASSKSKDTHNMVRKVFFQTKKQSLLPTTSQVIKHIAHSGKAIQFPHIMPKIKVNSFWSHQNSKLTLWRWFFFLVVRIARLLPDNIFVKPHTTQNETNIVDAPISDSASKTASCLNDWSNKGNQILRALLLVALFVRSACKLPSYMVLLGFS